MIRIWHVIIAMVVSLGVGITIGYFGGRSLLKDELKNILAPPSVVQKTAEILGQKPLNVPKKEEKNDHDAVKNTQNISASLIEKSFHEEKYRKEITLHLKFENLTEKDIRAFDGVLIFTDLLDNEIHGGKVAINEPVKSHQNIDWFGSIEYNEFIDKHRRLMNAEQKNIKIKYIVSKILYEDGKIESF